MPRRVQSVRNSFQLPDDALAQEVLAYKSGNEAERRSAEQTLEAAGAEALTPLGRAFIEEGNSPFLAAVLSDVRRVAHFGARVLAAAALVVLVSGLVGLLAGLLLPVGSAGFFFLISFCLYALAAGAIWRLFANETAFGNVVRTFGRTSVRPLLLKTLGRIASTDAESLTDAQSHVLNELLKTVVLRSDEETAVGVLHVLAKTGGSPELPAVEWSVHRPLKKPADRSIQRAARETLTTLRERVKDQQIADTYLRPSGPPQGNTPDELLRPAQGALPTPEQELLRAASADPELRE